MPFTGLPDQATHWESPDTAPQKLLSRDFVLLFCMAMFCNSYIAVFYCFEQWLEGINISPNWRGVLLSSLFAMVLLCRPLASVHLLQRSKCLPLLLSILVSSCVLLAYPFVGGPNALAWIWFLRISQGIALAVFSCCVTMVLVSCIPKGQSARGFALFSLTMLLPYSIIPAVGERILPLVGGEPHLFAYMALLGLPALLMLIPLAPRLRRREIPLPGNNGQSSSAQSLWQAVSHSGLFFVYLACLTFSIMTNQVIFFMKGLCSLTGGSPAVFFSTYTGTIILIRLFGSQRLDSLPRYRVMTLCTGLLIACMFCLAWAPLWTFLPVTCLYGLGLGLLYPLLAATVYDRSTPSTRSINSNVMMSTFDASGMLGPLLGGMVINWGYDYRGVFVAAGILITLSSVFILVDRTRLLWRERRAAQGPQ